MPRLVARVLGTFALEVDGRPVAASDFARRSARHLVQMLLVREDHRARREEIADLLWPELEPDRAAANLRKAIHFARQAFGEGQDVVVADATSVGLGRDVKLELDLDRLREGLHALAMPGPASAIARDVVLDLGGRRLLPDEPYEDWLVGLRGRLTTGWTDVARAAAEEAIRTGDALAARDIAGRLLAEDPADEAAHRVLIRSYLHDGRAHAARRQLAACRLAVLDAYGVEPEPETVALLGQGRLRVGQPPPAPAYPLVGREAELDAIEAALDSLDSQGRGGLVVLGPAGIGKTRLLDEAVQAAAAGGHPVLRIRGLEAAPELPLAPLATALAPFLEPTTLDQWPEPARGAGRLLVASPPADHGTVVGHPAALASAVADVIARAMGPGVVIAADDVQWLDDATMAVLAVAWSRGIAAGVLVAVRDEAMSGPHLAAFLDDLRRAGVRELRVAALGRGHVAALAQLELGGELTPALRDALCDRSGGSPLFCLELLRLGREREAVARDAGGRWDLNGPAEALGTPTSVGRLIDTRVAAMAAPTREVLVTAAELGDRTAFDTILRALPSIEPAAILDALDEGIRAGILREDGDGYAFAHPLFRSALRTSMPAGRRARLHLDVARAIAGSGGTGAPGGAGVPGVDATVDAVRVARHAFVAEAAGLPGARELAVDFGMLAVAQLAAVFDHEATAELGGVVVAAWERLPGAERAERRITPSMIRRAQALTALGREPEAAATLARAEALAVRPDDIAEAGRERSWLPYRHGAFDDALAVLQRVLDGLPADAVHARATVEQQVGWIRLRQGRPAEAIPLFEHCLAVFEGIGDERWTLQVLDKLGVALTAPPTVERAVRLLERSVSISQGLGDPRAELPAQLHLVSAYADLREWRLGRASLARALELAPVVGEPYLEAVACRVGGAMEALAGAPDRALDLYRRELDILGSIGGNPEHEATTLAEIAALEAAGGRATEADASAVQASRRAALAGEEVQVRVRVRLEKLGLARPAPS